MSRDAVTTARGCIIQEIDARWEGLYNSWWIGCISRSSPLSLAWVAMDYTGCTSETRSIDRMVLTVHADWSNGMRFRRGSDLWTTGSPADQLSKKGFDPQSSDFARMHHEAMVFFDKHLKHRWGVASRPSNLSQAKIAASTFACGWTIRIGLDKSLASPSESLSIFECFDSVYRDIREAACDLLLVLDEAKNFPLVCL